MSAGFPIEQNAENALKRMSDDKLLTYKREFAYQLLKNPADNFKAALNVFPTERQIALKVHNLWPSDPDVINFTREWIEQLTEEHFLPTRVDFLNKVWAKMSDVHIDFSDFAKLSDIYAKARGFYPEKNKAAESQVNIAGESAKVMIVQMAPSDEDWEKKLMANQAQLQAFNED